MSSSPSFHDAKRRRPSSISNEDIEMNNNLTLGQVQELLFEVQAHQEDAVRRMAALIDNMVEAEHAWKAHQSRVTILIRDRLASDTKEKSSADLREAEIFTLRDEEGNLGLTLHKNYRLAEERVKQADRYCRMLEKRGSLLQTLAANLRPIT